LGRELSELSAPPTPERVRLGRWLFHDPRLSADGSVSCSSCHRSEHGFSEPTAVSTGVGGGTGRRKAPPILNAAFAVYPAFFHDGRAASLEEQALGPMVSDVEMGNPDHDAIVARLVADGGYAPYFEEAFGDGEITIERVTRAIADYERTRLSGNSPWDRWQAGDHAAASDEVKLGSRLFFGKAGCVTCHLGDSFSDWRFHATGVGWDATSGSYSDRGRAGITGASGDEGAFKTPTLRDVARRAPYMHDGSLETLDEVVEFYDRGAAEGAPVSALVQPLGLSRAEKSALVAFLEALDGEGYQDSGPALFPTGR
jgi:cytochrome c peroxidase